MTLIVSNTSALASSSPTIKYFVLNTTCSGGSAKLRINRRGVSVLAEQILEVEMKLQYILRFQVTVSGKSLENEVLVQNMLAHSI